MQRIGLVDVEGGTVGEFGYRGKDHRRRCRSRCPHPLRSRARPGIRPRRPSSADLDDARVRVALRRILEFPDDDMLDHRDSMQAKLRADGRIVSGDARALSHASVAASSSACASHSDASRPRASPASLALAADRRAHTRTRTRHASRASSWSPVLPRANPTASTRCSPRTTASCMRRATDCPLAPVRLAALGIDPGDGVLARRRSGHARRWPRRRAPDRRRARSRRKRRGHAHRDAERAFRRRRHRIRRRASRCMVRPRSAHRSRCARARSLRWRDACCATSCRRGPTPGRGGAGRTRSRCCCTSIRSTMRASARASRPRTASGSPKADVMPPRAAPHAPIITFADDGIAVALAHACGPTRARRPGSARLRPRRRADAAARTDRRAHRRRRTRRASSARGPRPAWPRSLSGKLERRDAASRTAATAPVAWTARRPGPLAADRSLRFARHDLARARRARRARTRSGNRPPRRPGRGGGARGVGHPSGAGARIRGARRRRRPTSSTPISRSLPPFSLLRASTPRLRVSPTRSRAASASS